MGWRRASRNDEPALWWAELYPVHNESKSAFLRERVTFRCVKAHVPGPDEQRARLRHPNGSPELAFGKA
jgi:hypothetical protein